MNHMSKINFTLIILLAVVGGFLGGVAGVVPLLNFSKSTPVISYVTNSSSKSDVNILAIQNSARSQVLFFASDLKNGYTPVAATATGLVFTSDGWILTVNQALFDEKNNPRKLKAVVNGREYAVVESFADSYSGAALVKINAANLPVTDISEIVPNIDSKIFAVNYFKGIEKVDFVDFDDLPEVSASETVKSSEQISDVILLSGQFANIPTGSMLLDSQGKLIGLISKRGAVGFGIPTTAFTNVIGLATKNKKFVRPVLGITYFDASRLPGSLKGLVRGAIINSVLGKNLNLKTVKSADGLLTGDVIMAINNEEVSPRRGLSDMVVEYAPGTTIVLNVWRAGKEIKVNVKLE